MADKMTIKELLKKLEANRYTPDQGIDQEMASYNSGIDYAIGQIKASRKALIAGMREPLRFKKIRGMWVACDKDGKELFQRTSGDWLISYFMKENAEHHAKTVGTTAEFIDDTTDPESGK